MADQTKQESGRIIRICDIWCMREESEVSGLWKHRNSESNRIRGVVTTSRYGRRKKTMSGSSKSEWKISGTQDLSTGFISIKSRLRGRLRDEDSGLNEKWLKLCDFEKKTWAKDINISSRDQTCGSRLVSCSFLIKSDMGCVLSREVVQSDGELSGRYSKESRDVRDYHSYSHSRKAWLEQSNLVQLSEALKLVQWLLDDKEYVISQSLGVFQSGYAESSLQKRHSRVVTLESSRQLGMASALETLCGQAFGAKKYHMLGVYMQRSWIPDDIAELSGVVSVWVIPLHFAFCLSFPLQRFLQCQLKSHVPAFAAGVGLVVHFLVCWLFVDGLKLGAVGTMATNARISVDSLSICMTINGWENMIPLAFFAGTG
ncbi:hypothetical protein Bca4012_036106 [Brassica carinata]